MAYLEQDDRDQVEDKKKIDKLNLEYHSQREARIKANQELDPAIDERVAQFQLNAKDQVMINKIANDQHDKVMEMLKPGPQDIWSDVGKALNVPQFGRSEYAHKSGAESSRLAPDYTLLPPHLELETIARFQYGIDKHGEHWRDNWQKGKDDPDFLRDRLNHAKEHFNAILTGWHASDERPANWGDVQACLWFLSVMTWFKRNGTAFDQVFPNLRCPAETVIRHV